MILLGLVGNPASGKSTVAKYLQEKGALWINADLIARDVLNQTDVTKQLTEHFGSQILGNDGKIIRKVLASMVFGETQEKKSELDFLESVLHPPTRIEITQRLKAATTTGVQVVILDVPLLFESKWDLSCDLIWCVDAPRESRQKWASQRGWNAAELERREKNQISIEKKRRLSNLFLFNDATLSDLLDILDSQWSILVTMEQDEKDSSTDSHCF